MKIEKIFKKDRINYLIKISLYFLSVILFSIIYNFCEDNEFAGWVDTSSQSLLKEDKYLAYVFQKLSNKKQYITLEQFLKFPIYNNKGQWYILINKNNKTTNIKARQDKYDLFNKYKNSNNLLSETDFLGISISIDNINKAYIPNDVVFPNTFEVPTGTAVHNYFDRLYFSFISQSLLGYGDIFPISKRTRIIALFQSISSILILFIP